MSEATVETAEATENVAEDTTESAEDQAAEGQDQGGEPEVNWQEKFEAQRKVNRDLEKKLKGEAGTLREQLAEMQAKLEGREAEFESEKQQREAEAAALAKANDRILKAEIRAAAAGRLNDPSDALRYLDLSSFEVGDDGDVDTESVSAAITDLITEKPYLAAQGGRRFQGDADGGARKETRPKQLTKADLAGMSPDQINEARAQGRLDDLMGRKH